MSLAGWLGWNIRCPKKHFFLEFNFNLHTPLKINPKAYLTLHTQDADKPPATPNCCYSLTQLKRWRLGIGGYSSFEDYLDSLIRWHHCNYVKSEKIFTNYGCKITVIEEDWTQYVEAVYPLYYNVAQRHGDVLYDIRFFQAAAKRPDYKLICAWFEDKIIGMFLLQEELPTIHSVICGLDYHHSTKSYAYSWLHYALIHWAIETKKYQNVDIGLTANESKRAIGFEPISARMDIYSKGVITRNFLCAASLLTKATITSEAKLKLRFK